MYKGDSENLIYGRPSKSLAHTEDEIKAQRRRFLEDPIIKNFNSLLVKVYQTSIPTYILRADRLETVYDLNTQNLIHKIIDERDKYIETRYGTSF